MPRALDTRAPDEHRDGAAEPAAATVPAPPGPSGILWLQRAAGNQAVAAQLARQPTRSPAIYGNAPPSGPPAPAPEPPPRRTWGAPD